MVEVERENRVGEVNLSLSLSRRSIVCVIGGLYIHIYIYISSGGFQGGLEEGEGVRFFRAGIAICKGRCFYVMAETEDN